MTKQETIKEILEVMLYEQCCHDCVHYTVDSNDVQTRNEICDGCVKPFENDCMYVASEKAMDYVIERIKSVKK